MNLYIPIRKKNEQMKNDMTNVVIENLGIFSSHKGSSYLLKLRLYRATVANMNIQLQVKLKYQLILNIVF